jgi:tRNA pseudouridine55 synthase
VAERKGVILSVNKPPGWTSFDVVNKLRGVLKWKAVGHAGTLDPAATGVLIVLCGAATRRQPEFMALPKEYVATVRFGLTTSTDDLDGEITQNWALTGWNEEIIAETFAKFRGEILQIPPAVSAIKLAGKRSYKIVRGGKTPEHVARPVTIHTLVIENIQRPDVVVRIRCSSGTYIRAIARDAGAMLGWGGALAALERTAIGPYHVHNAFALEFILNHRAEFSGDRHV